MTTLAGLNAALGELQAQALPGDAPKLVFVQALLRRAAQQRPALQQQLVERATAVLADYRQSLAARPACGAEQPAAERCLPPGNSSQAVRALRAVLDGEEGAADAAALSAVSAQMRQQELHLLGVADDVLGAPPALRELRATRLLRGRQREVAIEQRIARAIANAPEDPGPLNPQMLAIRSLSAMRDYSPAYAKQFVVHLDTLMWLESLAGSDDAKSKKGGRKKLRR